MLIDNKEAGKIGIHTFTNASSFNVGESDVKIISIEFAASEEVMAQFFGSVILSVKADQVERSVTAAADAEKMCWTASGVLQLLSNEIYTGAVAALKSTFDTVTGKLKVKPKEEWSKVEGMHEAIVSKEIFQKAQDMIVPQKSPSETRKQHYICGCCGRGLNRRNGTDLYCARGYFLEDQ